LVEVKAWGISAFHTMAIFAKSIGGVLDRTGTLRVLPGRGLKKKLMPKVLFG
jgi:hypothetical protein